MIQSRDFPPIQRLALIGAAYLALYFDIVTGMMSPLAGTEAWFIANILKNCLRISAVCWLMAWAGGFGAYLQPGVKRFPAAKDILDALAIAGIIGLFIAVSSWLLAPHDWTNPVLKSLPKATQRGRFIVLALVSSLGTGYSEELFFRFFLIRNFEMTGFSTLYSVLISAVIFGLSHQAQGIPGMLIAGAAALLFSFAMLRGKSPHALALGHAMYDAGILLLLTT